MEVGENNFVHSYQRCYADTMGKNSQIAYSLKLCCNLSLFWKYVRIYHFLYTRVWRNHASQKKKKKRVRRNHVFHDTQVHEIRVP